MIQDQLVEYISTQMKAGISREAIKNTLIGAGWQSADVEDTLQKVESTKMSQPITASPASVGATSSAATVGGVAAKPVGPQTIKIGDLISTSDPAMMSTTSTTTTTSSSTSPANSKAFTGSRPADTKTTATTYTGNEYPPKTSSSSHGALIVEVVLGVLFLAAAGFAGYLYFQNNNLNSQVSTLNGQGSGSASQLAAMQQSFNASTTNWTNQITTLTGQSKELQTELSFYAVPVNASSGATSTVSVSGSLTGGGKNLYMINATYGAKVFITNSRDASATVEFAQLEASGTVATFTGIYMPGVNTMTVTGVNGNQL